jgi:hypothetical protein
MRQAKSFRLNESKFFDKVVLMVVEARFLLILIREGEAFRLFAFKRAGSLVLVRIFVERPLGVNEFSGAAAHFGEDFREIGDGVIYSKPLFGGKFLGMKAPSLRDVVGIAVSVVSCGAGGAVALAINLIDDVAFTALDVATGQMTWDEGLVSLGKAGLSSVVSSQIGGAFQGMMVADPGSIGEVVGNTLVKGMEKVATNVTVGAINAIEYSAGGNFGFNANAYKEGLIGTDALASYAGTMAGEFANSGFQALALGKYKYDASDPKKVIGYNNQWGLGLEDAGLIKSIGSVAGNAINAGVEYGISGHTTVNLLNFSDIAKVFHWDWFQKQSYNQATGESVPSGEWNSVGLFELTIDSKRGLSSRIGQGGIDLSLGSIVDAFRGLDILGKTMKIDSMVANDRILGNATDEEKKFKLRNQLSFGDVKDKEMLANIMAGKDTLYIGSELKDGGRGFTETNKDGRRNISAYSSGSSDYNVWLSESVTIQHEAYRSGLVEGNNSKETEEAVAAHTVMAMKMAGQFGGGFISQDSNLINDVIKYAAGKEAFSKYVSENYDSSADYWKLRINQNGTVTLEDDGRGGVFYKDAAGNEHELGHYQEGMSKSQHLANLFGPGVGRNDVLNAINVAGGEYDWDVGAFCYKDQYEGDQYGFSRKELTWNLSTDWSNRLLNKMPAQYEFGIMSNVNKITGEVKQNKAIWDQAGDVITGSAKWISEQWDALWNTNETKIRENKNYDVDVYNAWEKVTPRFVFESGEKTPEAYNQIIDQYDVENNQRYTPKVRKNEEGDEITITYCNVFIRDVGIAYGLEEDLPRFVEPGINKSATGASLGQELPEGFKGGYVQMGASRYGEWLDSQGAKYGWTQLNNYYDIQAMANKGYFTMGTIKEAEGRGHVLLVRPTPEGKGYDPNKGLYIAQAGSSNVITNGAYAFERYNWQNYLKGYKWWYHK